MDCRRGFMFGKTPIHANGTPLLCYPTLHSCRVGTTGTRDHEGAMARSFREGIQVLRGNFAPSRLRGLFLPHCVMNLLRWAHREPTTAGHLPPCAPLWYNQRFHG